VSQQGGRIHRQCRPVGGAKARPGAPLPPHPKHRKNIRRFIVPCPDALHPEPRQLAIPSVQSGLIWSSFHRGDGLTRRRPISRFIFDETGHHHDRLDCSYAFRDPEAANICAECSTWCFAPECPKTAKTVVHTVGAATRDHRFSGSPQVVLPRKLSGLTAVAGRRNGPIVVSAPPTAGSLRYTQKRMW